MTYKLLTLPLLLLGALSGCAGTSGSSGLSSSPDDSRDPELPTLPDDRAAGEAAAGAGGDGSTPDPDQVGSALGGAPSQELEIVDVAAGGDGAVDVSAAPEFMPATEAFYVFDQAGVIARRRFALDTASLALVSFDADGTQTSEPMLDLPLAAAARGDELVVLELTSEDALVVVSYDSQLEHGSKPLTLAGPGTSAQALGGSVDQNVAVWSEGTRLHGQLFSAQGKVGDVFDFGPHSSADHGTAARAVWTGERFVVLWTRLDANGKAVLSWGTIDEQGAPLSAKNLLGSGSPLQLEAAVALDDGRLAALLTLGSPAQNPLLVFVDASGTISHEAHVYGGATAAWSLASDGVGLLLAARSTRSQGVVRLLDSNGDTQSPWLVVDDSALDSNFEPRVALFKVDQGYGATVRLTDGSSAVLELDPSALPEP
jgi:hypothetical protein